MVEIEFHFTRDFFFFVFNPQGPKPATPSKTHEGNKNAQGKILGTPSTFVAAVQDSLEELAERQHPHLSSALSQLRETDAGTTQDIGDQI